MIDKKIIEKAINEVMEENYYLFGVFDFNFENRKTYSIDTEENLNKIPKRNIKNTELKKKIDIEFIDLTIPSSSAIVKLQILLKLLTQVDLKEIKKLAFENNKFFFSWNDIIDLVRYKLNNEKEIDLIKEIARKYKSKINDHDLFFLVDKIRNSQESFDIFFDFYKNMEDVLKINQKNYIVDMIEKKYTEDEIKNFKKFFKIEKNDEIFEEKERSFDYLNINVSNLIEKNSLSKTYITSIEDYEKIVRDILALINTNKKELGIIDIKFQNKVAKENNFLILIEKEKVFQKELFKFIFLGYMKNYFEEINKSQIEFPTEQNFYVHRRVTNEAIKKNSEKIFEYLIMKFSINNNSNQEKIRKNKI